VRERGRINLTILDLSMPRPSGREVLEQIRSVDAAAKGILSTGYPQHGGDESFEGWNVAAFVVKPYRPNELLRSVRKALDGQPQEPDPFPV